MSEIEKMFENAGIEPKKCWQSCMDCPKKTETRCNEYGDDYLTCDRLEDAENCPYAKEYYSIFTAEKQLELIKWLSHKYILHINYIDIKEFGYCLALGKSMEIIIWR